MIYNNINGYYYSLKFDSGVAMKHESDHMLRGSTRVEPSQYFFIFKKEQYF
jgi:hypothetical protein